MLPIMSMLIETDERSRVVLPGQRSQRFLLTEHEDGTLLLEPAVVLSKAQYEYDTNPELRDLLSRAAASPTVRRPRTRRTG